MNGDRARPRFFIGALAAIVAAVEGAFLLTRKQAKAAIITMVELPAEFIALVSSIASGVGSILEKLDELIEAVKNITGGAGGGYPENANSITSTFVSCPFAQPQTFPLPSIIIPKGMHLDILARNPAGVNTGIIWISGTQTGAGGNMQARPLIPNATVGYAVKNANVIWIGATVAGEGVYITVEQD